MPISQSEPGKLLNITGQTPRERKLTPKQTDLANVMAKLRQSLPTLTKQYGVNSLGVFGSYARHEERPGSDLDLLVSFAEPPGLLAFVELENYLTDLLEIKVDLVMQDALKPALGKRILAEVVPV